MAKEKAAKWQSLGFGTQCPYEPEKGMELWVQVSAYRVEIWPDYQVGRGEAIGMSRADARKVAKAILLLLDGDV